MINECLCKNILLPIKCTIHISVSGWMFEAQESEKSRTQAPHFLIMNSSRIQLAHK